MFNSNAYRIWNNEDQAVGTADRSFEAKTIQAITLHIDKKTTDFANNEVFLTISIGQEVLYPRVPLCVVQCFGNLFGAGDVQAMAGDLTEADYLAPLGNHVIDDGEKVRVQVENADGDSENIYISATAWIDDMIAPPEPMALFMRSDQSYHVKAVNQFMVFDIDGALDELSSYTAQYITGEETKTIPIDSAFHMWNVVSEGDQSAIKGFVPIKDFGEEYRDIQVDIQGGTALTSLLWVMIEQDPVIAEKSVRKVEAQAHKKIQSMSRREVMKAALVKGVRPSKIMPLVKLKRSTAVK